MVTGIVESSPAAGVFLDLGYTYDPAGLVRSEGDKAFAYDPNDRLESQSTDPAADYGYDQADNVTRASSPGGGDTLSYDAAHQLQTLSPDDGGGTGITYAYDQNGNRTAAEGDSTTHRAAGGAGVHESYGYDQADRLTGHTATGGQRTTYAYDGDGLRTAKTTASQGPNRYSWDIGGGLPLIIGDGQTAYITGPDGLPLAQIDAAGAVRYHHPDRLGSTRALTDEAGTVTATASFGPYGRPATSTGTSTTPFGFAGEYTDTETGFQYLRARYYDPNTQNFLTRDPAASTTRAPYAYASANPTNNTDPTGLGCAATDQGGGSGPGVIGPAPGEAPSIPWGPIIWGIVGGGTIGGGIWAITPDEPDEKPDSGGGSYDQPAPSEPGESPPKPSPNFQPPHERAPAPA